VAYQMVRIPMIFTEIEGQGDFCCYK